MSDLTSATLINIKFDICHFNYYEIDSKAQNSTIFIIICQILHVTLNNMKFDLCRFNKCQF